MARKMHSKVIWPGFSNAPDQRHVAKIGRNDKCPCGSGKKYKDCHQSEGTAFLEKLAKRHDKELVKQRKAELKAAGVPWHKRIFVSPQEDDE